MDMVVRRWLGEGSQSEVASDERQQRLSDLIRCFKPGYRSIIFSTMSLA